MLRKIKNNIKEKFDNLRIAFLDWVSIKNILLLLFEIILVLAFIALFVWVCKKIMFFIIDNYKLLLLCSSIVGGIAYYAWYKKEQYKQIRKEQEKKQMDIESEREKKSLEDAYLHIQNLLFLAIKDTAIITKIPPIHSLAALDAPTHFTKDSEGYYVFHYLVAKDADRSET